MTLAADTAHPRHTNWKTIAAEALAGTGVHASRPVHANLTAPALVAEAVRRDEGRLSVDGALVVTTGVHTGRSARDKFVVDEPSVTDEVWWGRINNRLPPEKFAVLKARVQAYLQGQELFTQDLYAGADPAHRVRVRMVTTGAWQALFSRNIFIRPRPEELADFEPDYIILHAPHFQTDPAIDGVRSGTSIALSFEQRIIVIAGSEYAGEVKKSIFTVMNWILPDRGVMPMHCSANIGGEGDVALFFGLSGTGKTTLSSDPHRRLIGDDEHGWSENGVFNFEGGCYAKVINLSAEHEPEIWAASHRFGTVLENVVADRAWQAGPHRPVADREHALGLSGGVHSEHRAVAARRPAAQRGDADLRCVRRDAADREADAGAGDVSLPVRLHRTGGGNREGPRRRTAGDVQHLLRRALPAAAAGGVRPDAGGTDRAARRGLLAGEHRLERRAVRRRPAHEHPPHPRPVARRAGRQPGAHAVTARSGSSACRSPSTCQACPPRCWTRARRGPTRRRTTGWRCELIGRFEKNFAAFEAGVGDEVRAAAIRAAA